MTERLNDLILVDCYDRPIGTAGKAEAHAAPLLHRAFSVFLINDNGELLLQKSFNSAVVLLRETDLPVSAIISAVGYENTSYFYRMFTQRYCVSPKKYRTDHSA